MQDYKLVDTAGEAMPVAVVSNTPFKTKYNASKFPDEGEKTSDEIITQPDQSMSIRELVYRYTHGMSLGGGRVGVYDEEGEIQYPSDWDKLDLSEKMEFFNEKAEEYKQLQEQLKVRENELREKQMKDEIDKRVNEKLEAVRKMRNPVADDVAPQTP